jgi:hypothetical protein
MSIFSSKNDILSDSWFYNIEINMEFSTLLKKESKYTSKYSSLYPRRTSTLN